MASSVPWPCGGSRQPMSLAMVSRGVQRTQPSTATRTPPASNVLEAILAERGRREGEVLRRPEAAVEAVVENERALCRTSDSPR